MKGESATNLEVTVLEIADIFEENARNLSQEAIRYLFIDGVHFHIRVDGIALEVKTRWESAENLPFFKELAYDYFTQKT